MFIVRFAAINQVVILPDVGGCKRITQVYFFMNLAVSWPLIPYPTFDASEALLSMSAVCPLTVALVIGGCCSLTVAWMPDAFPLTVAWVSGAEPQIREGVWGS